MPLNPNKKRCAVSGCNAWAMRGHTHCRAHRDAEPGSRRQRGAGARGAGAPPNNLNALRHGRYSHPLPDLDLQRLAAGIVEQPDDLPYRVGLAVQSIHARAGDPALTLVATSRLLSQLASQVAAALFDRRLQAYLCDLPAPLRERVRSTFERLAAVHSPVERLLLLKKIKKNAKKQSPEPGSPQSPQAGLWLRSGWQRKLISTVYSTVTLFARFLGWSTSHPLRTAIS